jgi:hypothetical protein
MIYSETYYILYVGNKTVCLLIKYKKKHRNIIIEYEHTRIIFTVRNKI